MQSDDNSKVTSTSELNNKTEVWTRWLTHHVTLTPISRLCSIVSGCMGHKTG